MPMAWTCIRVSLLVHSCMLGLGIIYNCAIQKNIIVTVEFVCTCSLSHKWTYPWPSCVHASLKPHPSEHSFSFHTSHFITTGVLQFHQNILGTWHQSISSKKVHIYNPFTFFCIVCFCLLVFFFPLSV